MQIIAYLALGEGAAGQEAVIAVLQVDLHGEAGAVVCHDHANTVCLSHQCKNEDRREGIGRRCFLGDRVASIPCRASYFAPG